MQGVIARTDPNRICDYLLCPLLFYVKLYHLWIRYHIFVLIAYIEVTVMPMIGDMAPSFRALTTIGEIDFPRDYYGKWVVLFSYGADFTPVSTTEIMTFASMINEFKEIDVELIGISRDSLYSHIAWIRKIKELVWKDMKHVEITFPLIEDEKNEIVKEYDLVGSTDQDGCLSGSIFIVDQVGKIRTILHYPTSVGINVKEIKRLVIALQKADVEHVLIPAQWLPEDDVMLPIPNNCSAAAERMEKVNENIYSVDWFLSFRQTNLIAEEEDKIVPEVNPYPSAFTVRRRTNFRR